MNITSSSFPRVYGLDELDREAGMGGFGTETRARQIPVIDLSDFSRRKPEITEQLWAAATDVGFFQIVNHGIAVEAIRAAFAEAERFFELPEKTKQRLQRPKGSNSGWESRAQVRPSTGTADQKESYQITRRHMDGLWPEENELPGFQANLLAFESQCWQVGMNVLSCFADKLGFKSDFFTEAHDPAKETYQSTLRLLHYYAMDPALADHTDLWRAGAHTDWNCLTLLVQRSGQGGLQVCPGKEADAQEWTSVEPRDDTITCNIGDMLMRWSDDRLKSTFHRVRNPRRGEYMGPRYSLPFFCQANRDAIVEGPLKKYPPITAGDYLQQRINANYSGY